MGYLGGLLPLIMYFGSNIYLKIGNATVGCEELIRLGHLTNSISGEACEKLDYVGVLSSISQYYHSIIGDVFVGILCTVGVFLITYKGYPKEADEWISDNAACNLAGVAALIVALYPTAVEGKLSPDVVGYIHFGAAAFFFISMALISWFKFTRSRFSVTKSQQDAPSTKKLSRNRIYRLCAGLIGLAILGIGLVLLFDLHISYEHWRPIFWLESLGLMAFGFSWLVKGKTILVDD